MKLLKEMLDAGKVLEVTVKQTVKSKKGVTLEAGTKVKCEFQPSFVRITTENGDAIKVPYAAASKFLTRFNKMPAMSTLNRMATDAVVTTPIGSRVEPDGYGPYGDPSWLIVLGVI